MTRFNDTKMELPPLPVAPPTASENVPPPGLGETSRAAGFAPFFVQQSLVTAINTWETVVSYTVKEGLEARLRQFAGADVAGATGLEWQLCISGSPPADIPPWTGIWSALDRPADIALDVSGNKKIELRVRDAAGGKTVRGRLAGFTVPDQKVNRRAARGHSR